MHLSRGSRLRHWALLSWAVIVAACRTVEIVPSLCDDQPTSAPTIAPLSKEYLDAALKAHAFAVSCTDSGEVDFGAAEVECAAIATSCLGWFACSSGGHCPDFCPDGMYSRCDGDTVVSCAVST